MSFLKGIKSITGVKTIKTVDKVHDASKAVSVKPVAIGVAGGAAVTLGLTQGGEVLGIAGRGIESIGEAVGVDLGMLPFYLFGGAGALAGGWLGAQVYSVPGIFIGGVGGAVAGGAVGLYST